jgi:hypothetical protein
VVGVESDDSTEEDEYVIQFEKPFMFEGNTYAEIDLSGIEELTTSQLKTAEKIYTKKGKVSAAPEMSTAYACIVAHMVSSRPIEFFDRLPAKEGMKIKNLLIGYLYN